MPEHERQHLWQWSSLAAAVTLLAVCLTLLGSLAAAAQGPAPDLPSIDQPVNAEPDRSLESVLTFVRPPDSGQPSRRAPSRALLDPAAGAPAFTPDATGRGLAPLAPPLPDGVDLAVCQSTDRVWGVLSAGDPVTVSVDTAQMGAALADGNGFFWTTLYDASGDRPGLGGGDVVAIYRNGAQGASVTLGTIVGSIDVANDTVYGTISGVSYPTQVTVYVGTDEPALTSYSQTVSTDGSGNFTADFTGVFDLFVWHQAIVAYSDGSAEVHEHVYPGPSLLVRPSPWNDVMGTSSGGTVVTATVYDSGWTVKSSLTLDADLVTGWYAWDEPGELLPGDSVVVDMAGGWTLSRTVEALSVSVDPGTDQVTGQAKPGQIVRGVAGGLTVNGWRDVTTSTTADPTSGVYILNFGGLTDIMPGTWAGVFAGDGEGDDLNLWDYSPSIEVHQTWNEVSGRAPAPSPPESPGRTVTLTLSSDPTVFATEMDWGGWYNFNQGDHGLPDIGPGDVVTVEAEGYAWVGVVQVKEMTVGHDVNADQFSGTVELPSDRVELNGTQWQNWAASGPMYPVGGYFETVTTASSAFAASPAGFDVRNAVEYDALHRTADNYLEMIYNQVDYLRVWPQYNGTLGHLGPPGTAFTLTLRAGDDSVKGEIYGESGEPTGDIGFWDFWPTGEQILPGDKLQAQSAAGFDQTVHIPDLEIEIDEIADVVSGSAPPNSLLYVQVQGEQTEDKGWVPTNADGQFAVAVDQLQQVQDGDLESNDWVMVCYLNEDGNYVCRNYEAPWARVNYGHDWVGVNYPAGHTFWITVTDDVGAPKGYATTDSGPGQGWGGDGAETREEDWTGGEPPDIVPGDWVHFRSDDGYNHSVQVGTIDGVIDTAADSVSGPIDVPWWVPHVDTLAIECHPWGAPDPNTPVKESTAGPDGDPHYLCQWDPNNEWDVQPGQDVAVMYIEPDDNDRVMNVFREPAPDMRVEKWPEGSDQVAAGGYAVFAIQYRNEGDVTADTVVLTDTLPPGTSHAADTSGDPTPTFGPGTVTWDLGPVAPGEERRFQLVLEIPASPDPALLNQADIWAEYDFNEWNDHAEAEVYVTGDVWYDPWIDKYAEPNEPAPGGTYIYEINYGNGGPVATGPTVLTDTLPAGTSVVDWYSENNYRLWNEASRNGKLVLEAPTLPGNWGDRIVLRLHVDAAVAIDTQLTNTVELDIPIGYAISMHNDAWVRGPYWNSHLNKDFNWGVLVPGGEVEFNVHMRNGGNQPTQTWLTDTLPTGTTFAQSWRWDGRQYIEWSPDQIVGNQVMWDMGTMLPGQWVNLDVRLNIDQGVASGTELENCAKLAIDGDDRQPFDNEDCAVATVREDGANMRVEKWHEWQDDDQVLRYEIRVENVGTERLEDVWIYDIYPEFTTFNDDWWVDHGPWITLTHDAPSRELAFWAEKFDPGETARLNFRVNLDDPDARPRWYTNAIEVPVDGDVYPADNTWEDVAVKGELDRVELWLEPFGHSNMWGEAQPSATVTVTTPVSQVTTIVGHPECDRCWGIDDVGPVEPGDTIIVESGAGLLPVVVDVPDPFAAAASSETDVVSGQIGGWLNERLEIHGYWPDGYQEVLTDGSGNFVATYDYVPPGADGYVRFETEANYARVVFHRPFRTMDLVMEVNYDHEWAQGSYEPGHTIWLTVTDEFGAVRDTAQVVSAPIPDWGGESGFSVNMQIEPFDWVTGRVDNGLSGALHVGTITGYLSTRNDSIHGTVGANWIAQQVRVECHTWGAPDPTPNKQDMVTPNGDDPYVCSWDPDTEWDIQLHEDVAVSYDDPDGHRVFAVFFKDSEVFLPVILKKH